MRMKSFPKLSYLKNSILGNASIFYGHYHLIETKTPKDALHDTKGYCQTSRNHSSQGLNAKKGSEWVLVCLPVFKTGVTPNRVG